MHIIVEFIAVKLNVIPLNIPHIYSISCIFNAKIRIYFMVRALCLVIVVVHIYFVRTYIILYDADDDPSYRGLLFYIYLDYNDTMCI